MLLVKKWYLFLSLLAFSKSSSEGESTTGNDEKCEFNQEMKYLYIKQRNCICSNKKPQHNFNLFLREVYDHNTNQLYFYMGNLKENEGNYSDLWNNMLSTLYLGIFDFISC